MGWLQRPVAACLETTNQLEAIRRLMRLREEKVFIAGAFDAQKLLKYDHNQIIKARHLLFEKLAPFTGR